MFHVLVVLLSLVYVLIVTADFLEEGSTCTLSLSEEEEGLCKSITECPYAQDLLKKKVYPQTCGFIGKIPLVCCKSVQNSTKPPTTSTTKIPDTLLLTPSLALQNLAALPNNDHGQLSKNSKANSTEPPTTSTTKTVHTPLQNLVASPAENYGELSRNKCFTYYPEPRYPSLVTGGNPSLAKEFPHMAAIGYGEKDNIQWLCGGSLISKTFVLTAAHCLTSKFGEPKYVRLGDLDLTSEDDLANPQEFTIVRRIPHPSFQPPARYHDIALVELDREVALSVFVSPACLNTEQELNETKLTATGWGDTRFGGNSSSIMMKVELNHITNDKCVELFGKTSNTLLPNGIADDLQVCAGGTIGQDTCQGDSGGPLQVRLRGRTFLVTVHILIGVTSFGKACGLSKAPGVYTRISSYIPWIESIAWEKEPAFYGWRPLN